MVSNTTEVASELPPVLRVYKDGTVERLLGSPFVPPSPKDPTTTVSSKDTTISPGVSARLYLPAATTTTTTTRLPILLYFHGGGFCIESAFSSSCHRYINSLVSHAQILAVSVEYRLAPEHPLPAAYEDSWSALQWVASHSIKTNTNLNSDPWLTHHGDFNRVYIGGDSAGANIAHNIAMRAGVETLFGGVEILGAFLSHPYFWGSDPIGSESRTDHEKSLLHKTWTFVYPSAPDGVDNPMINPLAYNAPSLAELKCSRLLVIVAAMDELRERGVRYGEAVKESGWGGDMEVWEVEGEDHCSHIFNPDSENAESLIKRLASFFL